MRKTFQVTSNWLKRKKKIAGLNCVICRVFILLIIRKYKKQIKRTIAWNKEDNSSDTAFAQAGIKGC